MARTSAMKQRLAWRAVHESSFAVCAHALGIRVRHAAVVLLEQVYGTVLLGHPPQWQGNKRSTARQRARARDYARLIVVAYHTGPIGEARIRGAAEPMSVAGCYDTAVYVLTQGAAPEELEATMAAIEEEAQQLVTKHWQAIEDVAESLLRHGYIKANDIELVLAERASADHGLTPNQEQRR